MLHYFYPQVLRLVKLNSDVAPKVVCQHRKIPHPITGRNSRPSPSFLPLSRAPSSVCRRFLPSNRRTMAAYSAPQVAGQKRQRSPELDDAEEVKSVVCTNGRYPAIPATEYRRLCHLSRTEQIQEAVKQMETYASGLPKGTNFLPPSWYYDAKAWRVDDYSGQVRQRRMHDDMLDAATPAKKRQCIEMRRAAAGDDSDDSDNSDDSDDDSDNSDDSGEEADVESEGDSSSNDDSDDSDGGEGYETPATVRDTSSEYRSQVSEEE